MPECQLNFLTSLPNVNTEKLNRLKTRLVMRQSSNRINEPPTFTGVQEFYKEFISVAASNVFNTHLKDALIVEIMELNETNFETSDLEEADVNDVKSVNNINSVNNISSVNNMKNVNDINNVSNINNVNISNVNISNVNINNVNINNVSINNVNINNVNNINSIDYVNSIDSITSIENINSVESINRVDNTTRQNYLKCIKSLRILAKFLGYIETIPYKYETVPPDKVLAAEIATRKFYTSDIDLKNILTSSLETGTLILTIPWLTEYLAMLDYVTIRLPYFQNILVQLFWLYHQFSENSSMVLENSLVLNTSSMVLLKFCLGWLFELPHFPSDQYFTWLSNPNYSINSKPITLRNKLVLDNLDIVDHNILFTCCPYLEEIKKLLQSNSARSGITVKHITPLSAVESTSEASEKRLKIQLEEAFFNGQPVSIRKTVDFISERVASACVKYICNTVVSNFKKGAIKEFKAKLGLERKDDARKMHVSK